MHGGVLPGAILFLIKGMSAIAQKVQALMSSSPCCENVLTLKTSADSKKTHVIHDDPRRSRLPDGAHALPKRIFEARSEHMPLPFTFRNKTCCNHVFF